jgi:hypothetical protein
MEDAAETDAAAAAFAALPRAPAAPSRRARNFHFYNSDEVLQQRRWRGDYDRLETKHGVQCVFCCGLGAASHAAAVVWAHVLALLACWCRGLWPYPARSLCRPSADYIQWWFPARTESAL